MNTHYRIVCLCALLAVAACGNDDGFNMPIPSAARGGVLPPDMIASPMRHGALHADVAETKPVAAPAEPAPDTMPAPDAAPVPPVMPAVAADATVAAPTPMPKLVADAPVAPVIKHGKKAKPQLSSTDADQALAAAMAQPVPPEQPAAPVLVPSKKVVAEKIAAGKIKAEPALAAATADANGDETPATLPVQASPGGGYVLGTGDEIRLTVYGEDDLSGQYQIGSTGIVSLPLVGNVQAAGMTIDQFEAAVGAKLSKGYLKDPRVSVQVANYRPFFILGEVSKPGSYPYVNGMTVMSAVATAGGYTYRADHGDIRVTHANVAHKQEQDIDETADILPGDIIRVTERFF